MYTAYITIAEDFRQLLLYLSELRLTIREFCFLEKVKPP